MKQLLQIFPRFPVYPCIIVQEIVGQPRLFGETFWGQIIRVPLRRDGLDGDIAFCDEVLYIGIYKPQSNAEAAAQIALCEGVVIGKFVEYLEGTVMFRSRGRRT